MDAFSTVAKIMDLVNKSTTDNIVDIIIQTKDLEAITYANKVKLITKLIKDKNAKQNKS